MRGEQSKPVLPVRAARLCTREEEEVPCTHLCLPRWGPHRDWTPDLTRVVGAGGCPEEPLSPWVELRSLSRIQ